MTDGKTLRDELAMSMNTETLLTIKDQKTIALISEKHGLEWGSDPIAQIEWYMKFEAIVRYMYADAMLVVR
jgi:hypothetical protein